MFKATVVLLAYNQQEYVEDAITALLNQDCEPVEIIISDDCSTDATWDIIQRVASAYRGPHSLRLNRCARNLGLIAHYNLCFEMAAAGIVIIAAGDDVSRSDRVQQVLLAFQRNETAKLVFSDVDLLALNVAEAAERYNTRAVFPTSTDLLSAADATSLFIGATAAYSKDLIRKYGPLPDGPCYEDLILGFRAALESGVVHLHEPLVQYRLGGISTAHFLEERDSQRLMALRLREMVKHLTVAGQRLKDARTYGLDESDPVIRRIKKWKVRLELRLSFIQGVSIPTVLLAIRHPGEALGALNFRRKINHRKN
jgi:glycosyltransferase involved in cell wall biosynthesis